MINQSNEGKALLERFNFTQIKEKVSKKIPHVGSREFSLACIEYMIENLVSTPKWEETKSHYNIECDVEMAYLIKCLDRGFPLNQVLAEVSEYAYFYLIEKYP